MQTRVLRTLSLVLLMFLALIPGVATAAPTSESSLPGGAATETRLAGEDRFETSAAVALAGYPSGADTVIIANARNFPDALAAAFLAGAVDAPILLVERDTVTAATTAALATLAPDRAIIVGGFAVVSLGVELILEDTITDVDRVSGADRYATMEKIIEEGLKTMAMGLAPAFAPATGMKKTGFLATGSQFPDALAAGPGSFAGSHPIFLTRGDRLPDETLAALRDSGVEQVYVLGGEAAISGAVITLVETEGIATQRLAGDDRYETAVKIATKVLELLGWDATNVALATGRNFPDALTLAPTAAGRQAVLVLVNQNDTGVQTFQFLQGICGGTDTIIIAGGETVVTADTAAQARLATDCADIITPFDGSNEDTAGDPDGAGLGSLWISGNSICYSIAITDVAIDSGIAAHIHEIDTTTSNPVVATLSAPNSRGFSVGCLTDADVANGTVAALRAEIADNPEDYYFNVHNTVYPAGAVRANLSLEGVRAMSGANEVKTDTNTSQPLFGQGDLGASGLANVTVFSDRVCYQVSVADLASNTVGVHIHQGRVDTNGNVVVALPVGGGTDFTRGGCVTIAPSLSLQLTTSPEDFYINLHTVNHPGGAVRAQLGADITERIDGDQEVPPSSATGAGNFNFHALDVDGANQTVCYSWTIFGTIAAGDATINAAHIHEAAEGVNGGVTLTLVGAAGSSAMANAACFTAPTATVAEILADPADYYTNLHTTTHPGGAYRAQLG